MQTERTDHIGLGLARHVASVVGGNVAMDEIKSLRARVAELERERDLAVAHDRQPYPTADAYEKVCAALEEHKARVAELEAYKERMEKAVVLPEMETAEQMVARMEMGRTIHRPVEYVVSRDSQWQVRLNAKRNEALEEAAAVADEWSDASFMTASVSSKFADLARAIRSKKVNQ